MAKNNDKLVVSDFNLEKLTTRQLESNFHASIQAGSNVAVFGRRGTGKTQIAKQVIKEVKHREVYVNLNVSERVDLGGYPNIMSSDATRKYVSFLLPAMYEPLIEGDQKCVVLLDEVDKADPSLWAPLLEFVQFHTINGRPLPNLQSVIMTGNLLSEGGNRPSLPLLDRAEKYIVEPDVESWFQWSGKVGRIHPSITAYVKDHPKDLFGDVDPGADRYADPSPRGWENASRLLYLGENFKWSDDVISKKVSGCVGKEVGIKFSHYYGHYQVLLPLVEQVFKGDLKKDKFNELEPTKKLVMAMIVCARFGAMLDTDTSEKVNPVIGYIGNFFKNVPLEIMLVALRSQLTLKRVAFHQLDERPEWSFISKLSHSLESF